MTVRGFSVDSVLKTAVPQQEIGSRSPSVEVAAAAAGGLGAEEGLRVPEGLGDDVDDGVPLVDRAGDARDARGLDEHDVLLEDPAPDHQVHEAGFVLKGHEDHAGGGPGTLSSPHFVNDLEHVHNFTVLSHKFRP